MSLILDALRKSEQSRPQMRESGWLSPGVARQTARVPVWGWALIALLLVNVLILLGFVLNDKPVSPDTVSTPAAISPPVVDTKAVATELVTPITTEPVAATTRRTSAESRAPARADLPSRDMLLAQGAAIPSVEITLHVFDPQRNTGFILLDGQRLGEGDTSRSGLRVNAISADGVVFGFGNSNFKVSIQ